jgi:hypothetical protein
VGGIAVGWPNITLGAFVILFAFYAFVTASVEAAGAFRSVKAGPVVGRYRPCSKASRTHSGTPLLPR